MRRVQTGDLSIEDYLRVPIPKLVNRRALHVMTEAYSNVSRGQLPREFAEARAAGDEVGTVDEFACRWLLQLYLEELGRGDVKPHGLASALLVWREICSDDLLPNRDLGGMNFFEYLCSRIAEAYDDNVPTANPRPGVNSVGF
jgi:hypothetical protein